MHFKSDTVILDMKTGSYTDADTSVVCARM